MPTDPRLATSAPDSFVLQPKREDPAWDGWDVAGLTVIAIIALVVTLYATVGVAHQIGAYRGMPIGKMMRDARVAVPAQGFGYLVIALFMYFIVKGRRGGAFWKAVKWNFPVRSWFGFVFLGIGLAFVLQMFSTLLPIPKKLPIDELFRDTTSAYILAFFGVVVAPVMEELFFRGFLYPVLARVFEGLGGRSGVLVAVVLTAIPFAFMHAGQLAIAWAPLLVLFLVGVALTAVRAKTQSLAASVLTHSGYNLTLFAIMFALTDGFRHLDKLTR